jgi:hypothetical protein
MKPDKATPLKGVVVDKRVDMNKREIVEYQIMHYCFVNSVQINHTEQKLLALLGATGKIRVTAFCERAVKAKILGSTQAVNTAMHKLYRTDLFIKEGIGKKVIYLNPKLQVLSEGNILIKLTLVKLETVKPAADLQKDRREAELA